MKTSCALCTYNGERFIKQQVASILDQSYPVDEILICDDKSTDGTLDILNELMDKFPGKIKLFCNETNIGSIKNFEKCLKLCHGDIIFLSDQDDVWHSCKVEEILKVFRYDKSALLVFSDGELIDENGTMLSGTLWEKWKFTKVLKKKWQNNNQAFKYLVRNQNKITGATVAFKKELKKDIFPFEFPLGMWHDTWLGLIAAGYGGLRFINCSLIKYRVHQNQQVGISYGINLNSKTNSQYSVSLEVFYKKVAEIFPEKTSLIYPPKRSIFMRGLNKIRKAFFE